MVKMVNWNTLTLHDKARWFKDNILMALRRRSHINVPSIQQTYNLYNENKCLLHIILTNVEDIYDIIEALDSGKFVLKFDWGFMLAKTGQPVDLHSLSENEADITIWASLNTLMTLTEGVDAEGRPYSVLDAEAHHKLAYEAKNQQTNVLGMLKMIDTILKDSNVQNELKKIQKQIT